MAQVLRFNFEIAGFTTIAVCTGGEAIRELETSQIDLVVTNLGMPDMAAGDLCRHIRQSMGRDELPIVLCSDKGTEADASHLVICHGISKVFCKPVSPKAIVAGVRGLLYNSATKPALAMV